MWAKIETVRGDQKTIDLPSAWAGNGAAAAEIRIGGKSGAAGVRYREDLPCPRDNCFASPGVIQLSDKLRDELCIPDEPVYQIKIIDSPQSRRIILGPVIGLLLGGATHRYNPLHMLKYSDRFGVYPQVGGLIYAFSPKFIHWDTQTAYGLFYDYAAASWQYGRFPLPDVIYRRDFHSDPEAVARLIAFTRGRLFNSYRFTKYELFDFIGQNNELQKHLPPTEYSQEFAQIKQFIDLHQKVILKPIDLSRGRGICILEKVGAGAASQYKVIDFRSKQPLVYELYNEELLEHFFDVFQELFHRYLVQKYLALAHIDHAPFDIRVVMQKGPDRAWSCSGIECRVSNNGYLTNISRGGYALPLDQALRQSFPRDAAGLAARISQFCFSFCAYMDTFGEHFAEFGMDIAIDREQNLWLIEANVFPSFKGFKKMDLDTYLSIRYTPLLYAASLTPFGNGEVRVPGVPGFPGQGEIP